MDTLFGASGLNASSVNPQTPGTQGLPASSSSSVSLEDAFRLMLGAGEKFASGAAIPEAMALKLARGTWEEAQRGRKGVRELEEGLISTIKEMGIDVVELTPEQSKGFRKAVRKPTHAAFLAQNPEIQGLYAEVKKTLKSIRKK